MSLKKLIVIRKNLICFLLCMTVMIMPFQTAIAVVDRVRLPVDSNVDTWLSVGTYYHSDEPLDTNKDDFIFSTAEAGAYSLCFHPMDRINEVIICVRDRYYEKVLEDHSYDVKGDLVYGCYLDSNETYYLRLYVINGIVGDGHGHINGVEAHFDFTINPPPAVTYEYDNTYEYDDAYDPYEYYPDETYEEGYEVTGDYVGDLYVVNCDEWVSLRQEPDTSSVRLAKVPYGAKVNDCFEASNGFYLGEYNGTMGFILSEYLSSSQPNVKSSTKHDSSKGDDRYDLNQYEYLPVVEKGRGALVFQKSPRGSFMKNHKFYDGDYVYVNINWRQNGYAIAYEGGEYGYVDASYIDW